jgi:hypothetical protein
VYKNTSHLTILLPSPLLFQVVNNQILFSQPPSFTYRTRIEYNTSNANAQHFLRYLDREQTQMVVELCLRESPAFV